VWLGIVDADKFQRVQGLLALNGRSNRSQVRTVQHAHALSGGLLVCGRCGEVMPGRSGTGRFGKTYFYYACTRRGCGLRVVAGEAEGAVPDVVRVLANDHETVTSLTGETNRLLQRKLPVLEKQLRGQQRALKRVVAESAVLLGREPWDDGRLFLNQRLRDLAGQREAIEAAIIETEQALTMTRAAGITSD
jgi:hypothetical protein